MILIIFFTGRIEIALLVLKCSIRIELMSRVIRPGFGDVTAPSIGNNSATPSRHFVDGHEQLDSPLNHDGRRENETEFGEHTFRERYLWVIIPRRESSQERSRH